MKKMRKRLLVDGAYYRPVPWLITPNDDRVNECTGCFFTDIGCISQGFCDDGQEFEGMIFIPATKAGMATYVARRLTGPPKEEDDD